MKLLDTLQSNLNRIHNWIISADQKISIFLAFEGLILSLILPLMIKWVPNHINDLHTWQIAFLYLGLFTYSYSILKCLYSLYPSIRSTDKKSLFYFGDIVKLPLTEFKHKINSLNSDKIIDDFAAQIYVNSKIAYSKYVHFKEAIILYLISLILLSITYLYEFVIRVWSIKMN